MPLKLENVEIDAELQPGIEEAYIGLQILKGKNSSCGSLGIAM
ncbi:hypothetical protein ACFLU6_10800 [Acidobacteriota bacterium]